MKKTSGRYLNYIILSGILIMFSACGGIYNATNLPIDQALKSDKSLKVKTYDGTVYKVAKLEKDDTGLYGVVKEQSNTARKHKEKIIERNYQVKYAKINIPENSIEEIRTKNQEMSILLPIAIGVAITAFVISNIVVMP